MSVGPMGAVPGSVAGSPLAQTSGSETERARQDAGAHQRRVRSDQKAESAAGIGETDGEDHEAADRDADGRRPWEAPPDSQSAPSADQDAASSSRPQDPSGESGNLLDLTG
jgi:hypothetical protein